MKTSYGNLKLRRLFIEALHGQVRDAARRIIAYGWSKINNRRLSFPFVVQVEATNDCMLNCIMCARFQLREKTGYMTLELFRKIVDECSRHYSFGELLFSGMGEPLLHPQIFEMIRLAKNAGIPKVRLTTNAVLLTRPNTLKILEDSGLDQISLSLDALTERTYETVKMSSHFRTVQCNIFHFLDQRRKLGRWKPFVNLHILKMKETASELNGFIKKWSPLLGQGDHILLKDVHTFAGQVKDRRLPEQICRRRRFPCRQLWRFLYVSWNGDVMPCCMDVCRSMRLGSLQETPIEALWNTPLLKTIREIHVQGRYHRIPLCTDCENWWY